MKEGKIVKKEKIINLGVSILFCVLLFIILLPTIAKISCFFRYQNTGRILLKIDGNETTLNNTDITFKLNEDLIEKRKITNGEFKFWKGEYGSNTCNFKIPAELYEGQTDIIFEVEYIGGNNWNINDFNINISITTVNGIKVYANGFVKTKSYMDPYDFGPVSKEITEKDNIIRLYAGI